MFLDSRYKGQETLMCCLCLKRLHKSYKNDGPNWKNWDQAGCRYVSQGHFICGGHTHIDFNVILMKTKNPIFVQFDNHHIIQHRLEKEDMYRKELDKFFPKVLTTLIYQSLYDC